MRTERRDGNERESREKEMRRRAERDSEGLKKNVTR